MLKLYFAPRTRAIRIRWLFEELGVPHELERVEFRPQSTPFAQATPFGKIPVLVDGEITIAESGAILEYVLENYGNGQLAPAVGSAQRGEFLQWVHFAEGTAFPPLGVLIWHGIYRGDASSIPQAMEAAHDRALASLAVVERHLATRDHLLGSAFSAADIMLGFTLAAAQFLGLLDARHPKTIAYLGRLMQRPAFQRAIAD